MDIDNAGIGPGLALAPDPETTLGKFWRFYEKTSRFRRIWNYAREHRHTVYEALCTTFQAGWLSAWAECENSPHREDRAKAFVLDRFGTEAFTSTQERASRVLEEAIELAQACGVTQGRALRSIAYVYEHPAGAPAQELGGVACTLYGLASAMETTVGHEFRREMSRIEAVTVEEFRARQRNKAAQGMSMVIEKVS